MNATVIAAAAFVLMEPFAAVTHRLLMHRRGYRLHASHHAPVRSRFERNDVFPVVFGAATVAVFAAGSFVPGLGVLSAIGAGITAYGIAYFVIHDVAIHGRVLGRPAGRSAYVRWVRRAHRVHHVGGAAPYGFLLPVLSPARARRYRDAGSRRDWSGRPVAAAAATSSLRVAETVTRRENTS